MWKVLFFSSLDYRRTPVLQEDSLVCGYTTLNMPDLFSELVGLVWGDMTELRV